jgi:ATP/maltotriose-dependent transcriptional regulator MalT
MANFALALTASRRGNLEAARTLSEEGLEICRELGDLWFVSYFLWILSMTATEAGDHATAREQADESLQVARDLEGPLLVVCALDATALVARTEGDDEAAGRFLTEAAELGRTTIVPNSYVASVLLGLGELATESGNFAEADALFEESLSRARGVADRWAEARAHSSQAALALRRGDRDGAEELGRETLAVQVEIGDQLGAVLTVERLASVVVDRDTDEAALLRGVAEAERERLGAPVPPWRRRDHEEVVRLARDALGDERYEANVRQGRETSMEEAALNRAPS